jgi:hypothetical protein
VVEGDLADSGGTGEGEERGWFGEGVERRVGDGAETLFWSDLWLGGMPFCIRFRRLYNLCLSVVYGGGDE